jgi:hypothetical protein
MAFKYVFGAPKGSKAGLPVLRFSTLIVANILLKSLTRTPIFGVVPPGEEQPSKGKTRKPFSKPFSFRKTLTELSDSANAPGVNREQSD